MLGVSPDDEASHGGFARSTTCPSRCSPTPIERREAYGVWREKTMYGKKRMGIDRSTFVIDADGTIVKAMRGVRPEGHPEKVLEALPG